MPQQLSNQTLLQRALSQRYDLEMQLDTIDRQDFQLATLKGRTDIKNFDEYHRQRREFSYQRETLKKKIDRLKGHEAITRARIAQERTVTAA